MLLIRAETTVSTYGSVEIARLEKKKKERKKKNNLAVLTNSSLVLPRWLLATLKVFVVTELLRSGTHQALQLDLASFPGFRLYCYIWHVCAILTYRLCDNPTLQNRTNMRDAVYTSAVTPKSLRVARVLVTFFSSV